jgi:hypothetical protein
MTAEFAYTTINTNHAPTKPGHNISPNLELFHKNSRNMKKNNVQNTAATSMM